MADAPDSRIHEAFVVGLTRAYLLRGSIVATASLVAGALVGLLAPGAPSWAHGWWVLGLAAIVGLRLLLARQPVAAGVKLTRLRAVTLLHAGWWGLLAWVGPPPADADQVAVLVQLQGGVAIGGMAMVLFDRRMALAFALLAGLPLVPRLLGLPLPLPPVVPVAMTMFVALVIGLWIVAGRTTRERLQLAAARLAKSDREADARRNEHLLQQVFDHVEEGICLFDPAFQLRAVNGRMAELIGLDPRLTSPGTPLRDWLMQLARAGEYGAVEPEAEVARRLADVTRLPSSVARRRRRDGRTIETRRTPLPDGGFAMVCADVSERVASEAALFENRRTLEVLLDKTDEGFWFIDKQLRTTDANRAMCRMLGVDREQLVGHTIYEFVDAENEAIFRRQVTLRAQGHAGSYEITLSRADGGRVHCWNNATPIHDAQGRNIGAIGLFSDISERKRAEALLAQQSRRLTTTLDSLSQGVLSIDAGGRIGAWNRRALELLQISEETLAVLGTLQALARWQLEQGHFGPEMALLTGETERSGVRMDIDGSDGPRPTSEVYRRRRLDGRVLEVRLHRAGDGGEVRTYTDVTAEVETTQALIAARDEAERANRAKSDFLSRMSHELRTPLNAILGFGQLLQRDVGEPLAAVQRERVERIVQGGQHLLSLVNEVLDLARIEAGTLPLSLQPLEPVALARECIELVMPMARERSVQLLGPELPSGDVPALRADPMRLRQVLLNLLANAIKHGRQGGHVVLRMQRADGSVRLEVQDDGPGLDEAQQQRLFKAFERLDADVRAVDGAGLGLALSRSLVERMGGRIAVHAVPGEGCRFWVELPLAAPPQGPRRVLYIEDNEVNQLLMQGMLAERPDLQLQLAALPETGLAMARAEVPDLVLLDIQLPGMSGYEVLQALRADPRLAGVPVVAVSANAMPQDLQRAQAAGFDGYLTKPLDLGQLLETVDRALSAR